MAPGTGDRCLPQHGARRACDRNGDSSVCTGPMHRYSDRGQQHSRLTTRAHDDSRRQSCVVCWVIQRPIAQIMSDGRLGATDKRRNACYMRRSTRVSRRGHQRFLSPILRLAERTHTGSAHPTIGARNGLIHTRNPWLHPSLLSSSGS